MVTAKKPKLPTIREIAAVVRLVKGSVPYVGASDAKAYIDPDCSDGLPTIALTIGWTPEDGSWSYQTGDNSYTGGAYGHPVWAVAYVSKTCDSRGIARDLIAQLDEQTW